jgi:hypothetical protein
VLSGRGFYDELITRPEESYRLCCVVVCDLGTSKICTPYIYMTLVTLGLKFVTRYNFGSHQHTKLVTNWYPIYVLFHIRCRFDWWQF